MMFPRVQAIKIITFFFLALSRCNSESCHHSTAVNTADSCSKCEAFVSFGCYFRFTLFIPVWPHLSHSSLLKRENSCLKMRQRESYSLREWVSVPAPLLTPLHLLLFFTDRITSPQFWVLVSRKRRRSVHSVKKMVWASTVSQMSKKPTCEPQWDVLWSACTTSHRARSEIIRKDFTCYS